MSRGSPFYGIRDFKAKSGRDSGLKVCAGGEIPKIILGITGLRELLGRDFGIKERHWGPSEHAQSRATDAERHCWIDMLWFLPLLLPVNNNFFVIGGYPWTSPNWPASIKVHRLKPSRASKSDFKFLILKMTNKPLDLSKINSSVKTSINYRKCEFMLALHAYNHKAQVYVTW